MTLVKPPWFDHVPAVPTSSDDPRWEQVVDTWLGTEFAARYDWPLASFDDASLSDGAILAAFDAARGGSVDWQVRRLSPMECWRRYQLVTHSRAAVLAAPRAEQWFDPVEGQVEHWDTISMLRWIETPPSGAARLLGFERDGATVLLYHYGSDLEGALILAPLRVADPPAIEQLRQLGATTARAGSDNVAVLLPQVDASTLVAFAIVPGPDIPFRGELEGPKPPPVHPSDLPDDIYASAWIGLADDNRGAPIEAVWHINWEAGGTWWLFRNSACVNGGEDVSHIPYKQTLSSEDFRKALAGCIDRNGGGATLPTFVVYGDRRGHCIYPIDVDDARVYYFDPWPGRSLLAVANNSLGIRALPVDDSWRYWSVTIEEFDRVAHAAMVKAGTWFDLCEIASTRPYETVRNGDLFRFFNMKETNWAAVEDGTEISVQPGNWQESISLTFVIDDAGHLVRSSLSVTRAWLSATQTRPFAFDLLKSFVQATTADVDQDECEMLINALWQVWRGESDELEGGASHLLNQV